MKNDCQIYSQLLFFILICITLPCSSRSGRYRIVSEPSSINEPNPHFHKKSKAINRISGGYTAEEDEFPSYVGLKAMDKVGNMKELCGGVAISDRLVLTAAHCFSGGDNYDIIVAPSIQMPALWDSLGVQVYKVDKLCPSLKFIASSQNPIHDYQILHLEKPIPQMKFAILASDQVQIGYRAIAVGNGLTDNSGFFPSYSDSLQALPVERVDCKKMEHPTRICFRSYDPKHKGDTCQGDSGSPIYSKTENGSHVVVGLTSFGPTKCEEGYRGLSMNADIYRGLEEIHGLAKNCTSA